MIGHTAVGRSNITRGGSMSATIAEECYFGPEALRTLLTQLPVGVLMADRQGRLVYANAAAQADVPRLPDAERVAGAADRVAREALSRADDLSVRHRPAY